MLQNAQSVAVQLEFVRPGLPVLYEVSDTTYSMIEKRPAEMVSTRTARIPLTVSPGGNSGAADLDGGAMGRGSSTEYDKAEVSPVQMKFGVEISKLVEYATNSNKKAVAQITKKAVVQAMKQFRKDIDTWLQTAGNGVIGTISSGGGTTTWTLANTPFGARLLRKNLVVGVYSSNLATKRGEATINSNPVRGLGKTQTVTVAADTASPSQNTDVIVVGGLTGATPTWVRGIPYHHDTTVSAATWQGIARTNDFAVANGVNANGASFSLPPFRLAVNQIIQELGEDALGDMQWHAHPAGLAGYEELGLSISTIERSGSNQALPDLLFDAKKTMYIAGFPVRRSIHADPTRFDLLNLASWFRIETAPVDYFEVGGNTIFAPYSSDGGPLAAYLFYFIAVMQFCTDNPKSLSSVTNVALPSGY
jgi:hypothetical protein